jgi:hypothetical protein
MKSLLNCVLLSVMVLSACGGGSDSKKHRDDDEPKKKDSEKKDKKDSDKKDDDGAVAQGSPAAATAEGCDPAVSARVYNPERLAVLNPCITATGTIAELDQNPDGDTHMLVKLDASQETLLNRKNEKKKEGDLVVEVVCSAPVTEKKVGSTCDGYTNAVHIPKVGDAVKVTGVFVNDSHNGWNEIHPASKIEPR